MKRTMMSVLFLAVLFLGACGQADNAVHEGIIEKLDFQKDKVYTAAVRHDYYSMTVNGQSYQLIQSDWETLEIGMDVKFKNIGHGIAKIVKE